FALKLPAISVLSIPLKLPSGTDVERITNRIAGKCSSRNLYHCRTVDADLRESRCGLALRRTIGQTKLARARDVEHLRNRHGDIEPVIRSSAWNAPTIVMELIRRPNDWQS